MDQQETAHLIQKLRESADLTHEELAKVSGVSRQTISKVERGTKVRTGTLLKIVEAIGEGEGGKLQYRFYNQTLMSLGVIDNYAPPNFDGPKVTEIEARDLVYKSVQYLAELSSRRKSELREVDRSLLEELKTLSAVTGARISDLLSD